MNCGTSDEFVPDEFTPIEVCAFPPFPQRTRKGWGTAHHHRTVILSGVGRVPCAIRSRKPALSEAEGDLRLLLLLFLSVATQSGRML